MPNKCGSAVVSNIEVRAGRALELLDPPVTKKPQDRETLRLSVNYRLSI